MGALAIGFALALLAAAPAFAFELTSPAFPVNGDIPRKHTCDAENVSPALTWTIPPTGTRSLVLIVEDPDAPRGTFTHWVLYDIPADTRELAEGKPVGKAGVNDFGKRGWGGPCPPPGPPHHYVFKLFPVDRAVSLPEGKSKADVLKAITGHVIGKPAELGGVYSRK
jgi:hypothetical protein